MASHSTPALFVYDGLSVLAAAADPSPVCRRDEDIGAGQDKGGQVRAGKVSRLIEEPL